MYKKLDLPVRIISEKAVEYKLFWIRNEKSFGGKGIFLTKKWVYKMNDISRISVKMIAIKVFVGEVITLWPTK